MHVRASLCRPGGVRADGASSGSGGTHLDCLVGATVQVALGGHQGSHPVVEAGELLLQLQLSAHDVPDLWEWP